MEHISHITGKLKHKIENAESPIEWILYSELVRLKIDCYLQYQLKGIRVDIAIPSVKLTIECDGKDYHQDKLRDAARDRAVNAQGWSVRRYSGSKIFWDAKGVALEIAKDFGLLPDESIKNEAEHLSWMEPVIFPFHQSNVDLLNEIEDEKEF